MRQIVCDTGPLVALSHLELLHALPALYVPVLTRAVLEEWTAGSRRNPAAFADGFEIAQNADPDPLLTVQLDPGESSVIQLARDRGISRVLIDERKGRKIARRVYGLETIGTAGVLVQARRAGLTSDLAPLFGRLRQQGYWIDDAIVSWAISEAG